MATNATTYSQVGQREDLEDVIYDVSPTETPFASMLPRVTADATYHEWQTDTLQAANKDNAAIEGDDAPTVSIDPTVRPGNSTQIFTKTIKVSGTQEAVRKAGRKSEIRYQTIKKGKEIKRDIEASFTQNNASNVGAVATARKSASAESWLITNISHGATGSTTGFVAGVVAAPTDGTTRVLTEAMLKTMISGAWTEGGDLEYIMVNAALKRAISVFPGIATQYHEVRDKTTYAGIDIYISDFGTHKIVPNRFMRVITVLGLDMQYWANARLRPMRRWKLAKTGDSDPYQLLTELTLVCRNEKASGKVADVTEV